VLVKKSSCHFIVAQAHLLKNDKEAFQVEGPIPDISIYELELYARLRI